MEWLTTGGKTFKSLSIGQTFDFISPNIGYNSFFHRCRKLNSRTYLDLSTDQKIRIGSINAMVYHTDMVCPKCNSDLVIDNNSKQCHKCNMLWPINFKF